MKKTTLTFVQDKETRRTVRYVANTERTYDADGNVTGIPAVSGTLYLDKDALDEPWPESIKVTVDPNGK